MERPLDHLQLQHAKTVMNCVTLNGFGAGQQELLEKRGEIGGGGGKGGRGREMLLTGNSPAAC